MLDSLRGRNGRGRQVLAIGVDGFALLVIAAAASGGSNQSATSTQATQPASSVPQPAPPQPQSASPKAAPLKADQNAAPPPPKPAAAPDFAKAAAILRADDRRYRAIEQQGMSVTLNRGQPNSYPAWFAWFKRYGQLTINDAGNRASDALGASSAALDDWESQDLANDIDRIASHGLAVGGPDDARARAQVIADDRTFRADFARNERDTDSVGAGH